MSNTEKYRLLSLIVINKNDRGISNTLSFLTKINSPVPYEIVVVDASNGKLDDIKLKYSSVRWFAFKLQKNKIRTIPEQRNYGVKKSKGEIIVFIDANCVPTSNWLEELIYPIIKDNENIVAGSARSKMGKSIYDDKEGVNIGKIYLDEARTLNLALKRKVFDVVGEFDEKLDYGEDVDFSWRAISLGYKIRYIQEAEVTHDWGSNANGIVRAYRYGRGRTRLYKKYPCRWKGLLSKDMNVIIYPLFLLGLPLTIIYWPYPFLILVPFFKNIKKQPIKTVVNHIIFGTGVIRELFQP